MHVIINAAEICISLQELIQYGYMYTDTCSNRYHIFGNTLNELEKYKVKHCTDTCTHRLSIFGGFQLIASQLPSFLAKLQRKEIQRRSVFFFLNDQIQ